MALFVLGAGATRGCSFVDPKVDACIPPLDADFFTQLQRVANPKHQDLVSDVMKDVVSLFGHNFSASLETVFATLEHTIRMLKTTGDTRSFKRSELVGKRDRLLQAIALVLEESLCEIKTGSRSSLTIKECENHRRLVQDALQACDDIISFNYDCTIDMALRDHGDSKWNPRYGYGFNLGSRGSRLKGDQYWEPGKPASKQRTIHLHKLHGSLHFQVAEKGKYQVNLKQRPYTRQNGDLRFKILPPESNKAYDQGVFAELWKGAGLAIKSAQNIVMIGYSLPPTDLHANALFRTSVGAGKLKSLVVVNPDRIVRQQTRSALQRGISEETRILSFDCMEEFLAVDKTVWRK